MKHLNGILIGNEFARFAWNATGNSIHNPPEVAGISFKNNTTASRARLSSRAQPWQPSASARLRREGNTATGPRPCCVLLIRAADALPYRDAHERRD